MLRDETEKLATRGELKREAARLEERIRLLATKDELRAEVKTLATREELKNETRKLEDKLEKLEGEGSQARGQIVQGSKKR